MQSPTDSFQVILTLELQKRSDKLSDHCGFILLDLSFFKPVRNKKHHSIHTVLTVQCLCVCAFIKVGKCSKIQ